MNQWIYKSALFFCGMTSCYAVSAQRRDIPPSVVTDTAKPKLPVVPKTGPKPFKEIITEKAVADSGLFTVYKVDDKYYFEIPNKMLGREILVVARVSKAPAVADGGRSVYAGDEVNENVIKFEKGPSNKIFLKNVSFLEIGHDSTEGMYKNVLNSSVQPIAAAFPVAAFSKDGSGSVIDVTDYVSADNDIFFFDGSYKRRLNLGAMQADKSYILSIKSHSANIEIKSLKTFTKTAAPSLIPGFPSGGGGQPVTLELNTSLVLLPEKPMQPRFFDDRVGYFTTQTATDFDANPQGIEHIQMIARYRLEPKPGDIEKYKRGELVEPQKQIVYYIDPTTPKKWVPYLIAGINDWNAAFEKAGFKNAIAGKLAPTYEQDSTFSIDDASHSAIIYKASDIANASGPNIHDPRSGEIIESHVNWYHNVMSLIHDWYFVQAGAVDAKARKMEFDDELMGQLIRFVSSHEVGHTLGLRHNFGSSSTTPVEKLRDKAWVEANGHTASIMDYARFNYVAQPEDNVTAPGLFPRIGDYDKWAIEWGYRWFPDAKSPEDEKTILNKLTIAKLSSDKRLWWGDGESNRDDPRSQTEDIGDNAMKASSYGIKNLQRIVTQLPAWTKEPNKDYTDLKNMYNAVIGQFTRYIGHVSNNVGGLQRTPKKVEQSGSVFEFTPKATQKEAMAWLQTNVFITPTWILQKNFTASIAGLEPQAIIVGLQNAALNRLMSPNTWNKLLRFENEEPGDAYTVSDMLVDLRKDILGELATHQPIDAYHRSLQRVYVGKLIDLMVSPPPPANVSPQLVALLGLGGLNKTGDGIALARAELRSILAQLKAAAPLMPNAISKAHVSELQDRIQKALDPK